MRLISEYLKARTAATGGKNTPNCQLSDEQIHIWLQHLVMGMQLPGFFIYLNCFCPHSIAYIEFKTEAEAEKMLEEAQGADVQGRSIMVDFVGEKSQKGAKVSGN